MAPAKADVLDQAARHVCPNRVELLRALGMEIVIGRRAGYRMWDLDGRELLDFHLNGGVFNLGHRNPEIVTALTEALETLDIGNHHFPSVERAALAEELARLTPGDLTYSVFASGGGEAIDVALKTARHATGRRRIVSLRAGYHGHTGLALAAGDEHAARFFHSAGREEEFTHVPFADIDAMAAALADGDAAAVIVETIPATSGFPVPPPGYLAAVKALCERHGTLFVADEVQTGLGRTGPLWAIEAHGVEPDILVTGKGLSGGVYPIAAAVISERAAGWLREDGWAHISTFGGAEVGCRVARAVLAISTRASTRERVAALAARFADGLEAARAAHPEWLVEVRQSGLVIGLRFAHPQGGMLMTKALHERGLWAMFAGFDRSVLQFKPGLLLADADADLALERLEAAVASCAGAGAGA